MGTIASRIKERNIIMVQIYNKLPEENLYFGNSDYPPHKKSSFEI
jgi:hypothetical protein